jgi:hypothetical protein
MSRSALGLALLCPPASVLPFVRRSLLMACFALVAACGSSTSPSGNGRVQYTVTGTAQHVALTYQNSSGGTDQKGASLPFSYSWSTAKTGDFLYISAQIDTSPDSGSITVTISKNGKTAFTGNATGFANIATASGTF